MHRWSYLRSYELDSIQISVLFHHLILKLVCNWISSIKKLQLTEAPFLPYICAQVAVVARVKPKLPSSHMYFVKLNTGILAVIQDEVSDANYDVINTQVWDQQAGHLFSYAWCYQQAFFEQQTLTEQAASSFIMGKVLHFIPVLCMTYAQMV